MAQNPSQFGKCGNHHQLARSGNTSNSAHSSSSSLPYPSHCQMKNSPRDTETLTHNLSMLAVSEHELAVESRLDPNCSFSYATIFSFVPNSFLLLIPQGELQRTASASHVMGMKPRKASGRGLRQGLSKVLQVVRHGQSELCIRGWENCCHGDGPAKGGLREQAARHAGS